MSSTDLLTEDEAMVLEKYRRALEFKHSTLEIHVQDSVIVRINLTEKFKPAKDARLREV